VNELEVDNLPAAAYLVAVGCRIVRREPGFWLTWLFENGDGEARAALDHWQSGEACPVDGHAYAKVTGLLRRDVFESRKVA
jgi:hypothetical protein